MCLILFQRCERHATQEKMGVGTKDRPSGNANRATGKASRVQQIRDESLPGVSQQQSRLGFLEHGPSQAEETTCSRGKESNPTRGTANRSLVERNLLLKQGSGHPCDSAWHSENSASSRFSRPLLSCCSGGEGRQERGPCKF